jgi:hypothetical protein
MLVAFQLVGFAAVPLNVTVLIAWVPPKPVPMIVTAVPIGPLVGARLVMFGVTPKFTQLLATPATVTTTSPGVAPPGTVATMRVVLQLVGVASVPLKVTVLEPWVEPKFAPVMVTEVPTAPDVGDTLVMLGPPATTVKVNPLLLCPLADTITVPVVAPTGTVATILVLPQLLMLATAPLMYTTPAPCAAPKPVPVIATDVPITPAVGDTLVSVGGLEGQIV